MNIVLTHPPFNKKNIENSYKLYQAKLINFFLNILPSILLQSNHWKLEQTCLWQTSSEVASVVTKHLYVHLPLSICQPCRPKPMQRDSAIFKSSKYITGHGTK